MNLSYKQKSDIEFFIARVGKTKCGAILISYLIFPILATLIFIINILYIMISSLIYSIKMFYNEVSYTIINDYKVIFLGVLPYKKFRERCEFIYNEFIEADKRIQENKIKMKEFENYEDD